MRNLVAMVINTSGLQFDDRLRKECGSLARKGIEHHIYALERTNKATCGETSYGSPFTTLSLSTRNWFSQKHGLAFKLLEMYFRLLALIIQGKPRTVWLHDPEMFGLVALCLCIKKFKLIKHVVWDQHELPPEMVLQSRFLGGVLKYIMARCDTVVVANEERMTYLDECLNFDTTVQFAVIDNYADRAFKEKPCASLRRILNHGLAAASSSSPRGEPILGDSPVN